MRRLWSHVFALGLTTIIGSLITVGQVAAKPIRIGVLTDISGLQSDLAGRGSIIAAQMAAEEAGAVLGAPVEVLSADHQNKPDVGSAIATSWLDREGVDLIVDLPTSSVALAVQEVVRRKRGINIVSSGASTALIRKSCSPYGFLWTYSTYTQAHGVGDAMVADGGDTWFFIQADYAFGEAMAADLRKAVEAKGGKVLGIAKHPQGTPDFSSLLLRAQASGAKVIALLNAGQDVVNSIKQSREFGIVSAGQRLATFIFFETDAKAIGLDVAAGLTVMNGFYWQQSPAAKVWSQRYFERAGRMPTSAQIGVYSAVKHYLKAIKAAGNDERDSIVRYMHSLPVEDVFVSGGRVRSDGAMLHEMLLERVKSPQDAQGEWDVFQIVQRIDGERAFGPAQDCQND